MQFRGGMTFVRPLLGVAVALAALCTCTPGEPLDVVPPSSSTWTTSAASAREVPAVYEWRLVARATTRAIATDEAHVYFGDDLAGALYRAPKRAVRPFAEGVPTLDAVAVGTPAPRAIAVGSTSVVWIGLTGDIVLRMPRGGGATQVALDHRTFTAVAASGPEVFVAEKAPGGGTLTRITGPTATPFAHFEAPPSALAVDDESVFVETPTSLDRVSRRTGEVARVATGAAFSQLASDGQALYVTEPRGPSRALVRVRKDGSAQTLQTAGVREGPIATHGGWVYYLEADEGPSLRRVATTGGETKLVARSVALRHVTAMTVDEGAIYVACGEGLGALVLQMPIVQLPRSPTH